MIYLAAKCYGACLINELHYQPESYREFLHIHHLIILHSMKKIKCNKNHVFFEYLLLHIFSEPLM
jgi:hypothetical protein